MSYLEDLIEEVNKTHPGLGELVATCQIVVKAKKMMLVVSPSGCGKSTAMRIIGKHTPEAIMPDKFSLTGIHSRVEVLSNFNSVVIVDDMATTETKEARRATITCLVALTYMHRIEICMAYGDYTIDNFNGSALVGIQPYLLRELMYSENWQVNTRDKTLRYYHLKRPIKPNEELLTMKLEYGINIDKVKDFEPNYQDRNWQNLTRLGHCQWSNARVHEHVKAYLKAISALENRVEVVSTDYDLLCRLLAPMAIEQIVTSKEELESPTELNKDLLAMLTEYYTYNNAMSLGQIALDFGLGLSSCRKIMSSQNGYWQQVSKSPTIYKASAELVKVLKHYNLVIKE